MSGGRGGLARGGAPTAAWSFARHRVLATCPRQYWFEYVAGKSPEADEELRARLKALKRLVAFGNLRGAFVHDAIGKLMAALVAGQEVDVAAACAEVVGWIDAAEGNAATQVTEAYNGAKFGGEPFAAIRKEAQ